MEFSEEIFFLHLSDIHFTNPSNKEFDLDNDLRNELELKVQEEAKLLPNIQGILISGDIAYGGNKSEYDQAITWLNDLTAKAGVRVEDVWCVPGNHDVHISKVNNSETIKSLRKTIRTEAENKIDELITKIADDVESGESILKPFAQYNDFADIYGCKFDRNKFWWKQDFILNDKSIFQLRGVNTSLTSDLNDHPETQKLVVGQADFTLRRISGVTHGVICHHPLEWLERKDEIEKLINSRAVLQLFGHEHIHAVKSSDSWVQVFSGSLHPHRREDNWKPRYNWIGIKVIGTSNDRKLKISILPRKYCEENTKFKTDYDFCDGSEFKEYVVPVDSWDGNISKEELRVEEPNKPEIEMGIDEMVNEKGKDKRGVFCQYLQLPWSKQLRILTELNLISDEDEMLSKRERLANAMKRASDKNELDNLLNKIEEYFKSA